MESTTAILGKRWNFIELTHGSSNFSHQLYNIHSGNFFSREARGKVKFAYCKGKAFWDAIVKLVMLVTLVTQLLVKSIIAVARVYQVAQFYARRHTIINLSYMQNRFTYHTLHLQKLLCHHFSDSDSKMTVSDWMTGPKC